MVGIIASIYRSDEDLNCDTLRHKGQEKLTRLKESNAPDHVLKHLVDEQEKLISHNCKSDRHNLVVGRIRLKKCLCNYRDTSSYSIYVDPYEKGVLPFKGALSDQPAKYIEYLNYYLNIKSAFNLHVQNKVQKKMRNKNGRH